MKLRSGVFAWLIASAALTPRSADWAKVAQGAKPPQRKFVPQAVVVTKQKLREIANRPNTGRKSSSAGSPQRKKRDLLEALEILLTDFGIKKARAASNDLLSGQYDFLHELPRNDRLVLAPVVAELTKLFPKEAGLRSRLRPEIATLSQLQRDKNPVVARKAKGLVALTVGRGVSNYTNVDLIRDAEAFLKLGRSGLLPYPSISGDLLAQLREKVPELEALAAAPGENTIYAERAYILIDIANGKEVPGFIEPQALRLAEKFLSDGRSGLLAFRRDGEVLNELLRERMPELEALSHDKNPIVSQRARDLILFVNNNGPVRKETTLKMIARAFLGNGRKGLEDCNVVSDSRIARLIEKLSELEALTTDENPVVAKRARQLVRLANGDKEIGRQANTLSQAAAAFLERGRAGLREVKVLSPLLREDLVQKLPELERLAKDPDGVVAKWAKVLIAAATGEETEERSSSIHAVGSAFLKRGRDGLLDPEKISEGRLAALIQRLPELEGFTKDENPTVAERARLLIRLAYGEESLGRKKGTLSDIMTAFLTYGRSGLVDYERISQSGLGKLENRRGELARLTHSNNAVVAYRAKLLERVLDGEDILDYRGRWVRALAGSFLTNGQEGLLHPGTVANPFIDKLVDRLPDLQQLLLDEDATVASAADVLIDVAKRGEITRAERVRLYRLVRGFLENGRRALVGFQPGSSLKEQPSAELDNLVMGDVFREDGGK